MRGREGDLVAGPCVPRLGLCRKWILRDCDYGPAAVIGALAGSVCVWAWMCAWGVSVPGAVISGNQSWFVSDGDGKWHVLGQFRVECLLL